MKILIAVVNARSRKVWADAIRSTWFSLFPKDKADVLFFVGRGEGEVSADTVVLDCDDSYMGLPDKVREIIRWAYAHGYDFVMKCDDDVVLNPKMLLDSEFRRFDYIGRANRMPTKDNPFWVPMGFNYWLSRRSMQCIIDAPLPTEGNDDEKWVAQNLYKAGIKLQDDQHYVLQYGDINIIRPEVIVRKIWRPLPTGVNQKQPPDTFSWCIFFEGNSGNSISVDTKIKGFHKVFTDFVKGSKL